jgi:kynurenine formamidase
MRIRSFVVAYTLVLALLLFADRRPSDSAANHYTRVVDLTAEPSSLATRADRDRLSGTRLISPAALIPGTWSAGKIPPERLVAPLVVMDLRQATEHPQIELGDIAEWEAAHGIVPQGAVVAIRQANDAQLSAGEAMPITSEAAQFLMDARYTLGFAVETAPDMAADRTLARQIALHGDYVIAGTRRLAAVPLIGSVAMVAPAKSNVTEAPVRLLAMIR